MPHSKFVYLEMILTQFQFTLLTTNLKMMKTEPDKSGFVAIRFVAGKYSGKSGWIDPTRKEGENTIPVIVNLGKMGEKNTYVYLENIAFPRKGAPPSYAYAVIDQCPDVERKIVGVCRSLAKCNIAKDYSGFHAIMEEKIKEAVGNQQNKGSEALYRNIAYNN